MTTEIERESKFLKFENPAWRSEGNERDMLRTLKVLWNSIVYTFHFKAHSSVLLLPS